MGSGTGRKVNSRGRECSKNKILEGVDLTFLLVEEIKFCLDTTIIPTLKDSSRWAG